MTRRKRNNIAFNIGGILVFLTALMGPGAIDRALTHFGL
jgi:hypothetical protein